MKRLLSICLTLILFALIGCTTNENDKKEYSLLVVEGDKNISEDFGKYGGNESPVAEMEYFTSLKAAKERYPSYEIEKSPAVFIFETGGGDMKKLKFKTYDVEEAIGFLREVT
ncbi:hypothetical protein [Lentibacillus amyloliquefaciens]|uniref:Small peptidoglycan-associated lipoprotein n=1 Tax=Lentibacillus amyloliquefaciens TaxID=1472767 RepID=A0A0U4F4J2_9BACI|nr:hypothetical protein [Lentibacillus amyloliquefaciens]ALX47667.1 hypothetical protein AOX59_03040 [Lentibacillus amyloliquefaciens]